MTSSRSTKEVLALAEPLSQGITPPGFCNNQTKGCCGYCKPCGTRANQARDDIFNDLVIALKEEHRRVIELLEELEDRPSYSPAGDFLPGEY